MLVLGCVDVTAPAVAGGPVAIKTDSTAVVTEYDLDGGYPITLHFIDEGRFPT